MQECFLRKILVMHINSPRFMKNKAIVDSWGKHGVEMAGVIDSRLAGLGFTEDVGSSDPGYLRWIRLFADELSQVISLRVFDWNGELYFRTEMLIYSLRIRAVLSDIKEWECFETPLFLRPDINEPVCVLHLGEIEWWEIYCKEGRVPVGQQYRAWRLSSSSYNCLVEEWFCLFREYGMSVIDNLTTTNGVISFLQNIDSFPDKKNAGMGAPGSSDPATYRAILRYLMGDVKGACDDLIMGRDKIVMELRNGNISKVAYEQNLCKIDRLLAFVNRMTH